MSMEAASVLPVEITGNTNCSDCPALELYLQSTDQPRRFSAEDCAYWKDVAERRGVDIACGFVAMLATQKGMSDRSDGGAA